MRTQLRAVPTRLFEGAALLVVVAGLGWTVPDPGLLPFLPCDVKEHYQRLEASGVPLSRWERLGYSFLLARTQPCEVE